MLKQDQRNKILILVMGLFLTSCQNEKQPLDLKNAILPSQPHQEFQQDPLDYINQIRQDNGLGMLSYNEILSNAAYNHARYNVENNYNWHDEVSSNNFFTGENPSIRAQKIGYFSNVMENISINARDYISAIDGLMSAIYHRFIFLNPNIDEIGINFYEKDGQNNYAFEMGNSRIDNFCKNAKSDDGYGKFFFNICKDKNLKISEKKFNNLFNINRSSFIYYPRGENVKNLYSNEIPNPISECKVTANPISIEFNKNQPDIKMTDFKIYDDKNLELKNTKIITSKNDENRILNDFQFVLFDKDVFDFGKNYKVVFNYIQKNTPKTIEWTFKTKTPEYPYFIIEKNDNLIVENNKFYDIFFKPKDCNDFLDSFTYEYKNMEKPEIISSDVNTLRIKLNGYENAKLKIKGANKEINIYIKNPNPSNKNDLITYALISIALIGITAIFIKKIKAN